MADLGKLERGGTYDVEDDIATLQERATEDVEGQVATRLDTSERVPVAHVGECEVFLLDLKHLAATVYLDNGELGYGYAAGEDVALEEQN